MSKLFTVNINIWLTVFALLTGHISYANQSCKSAIEPSATTKAGAAFLLSKNPNLHSSPIVARASNKSLQKPADKVAAWIVYLENLYRSLQNKPQSREKIRQIFHSHFVMKPSDVPQSYYDFQAQLAKERGHGDVTLSQSQKNELADNITVDQKKSLDVWIDYFLAKDTEMYPVWLKYWVLTGMVKLSKFDLETFSFGNRSKETVAPFVELNREALSYVIDNVLKKIKGEDLASIQDKDLIGLLDGLNFGKLYAHALKKAGVGKKGQFYSNEGKWVKYIQGTSHIPLYQSLQGRNTGWCTAGESTARSQLAAGDFHVFYSKDETGNFLAPRVAIRMEGNSIAEVRGVGLDQNLDSEISSTDVVNRKIEEFGEKGIQYQKKDKDMKLLTEIERKHKLGINLNKEEVRFLYEFERPIEGFGYKVDPRIEEIKSQRRLKADLIVAFDRKILESEVSLTREEALSGNSKFHYGKLDLNDITSTYGLVLPGIVFGDLLLNGLTSAQGLVLPETVSGIVLLNGLTSAQGLVVPQSFNSKLYFSKLNTTRGLVLPESFDGGLYFGAITSAEGLVLPQSLKSLSLPQLRSAEGLVLPESLKSLSLPQLRSAEGLVLPRSLAEVSLGSLTSAKDLVIPESFDGDLYLTGMSSDQDLVLPQSYKGKVYFRR